MSIKLTAINKSFGPLHVLKDINLEIGEMEQVALVGSSGSGKSTLLYLLGALDRPTSGSVEIGGKKIEHLDDESLALFRNQNIGFVFQFHFLLPSMSCLNNILLPVQIAGEEISDKLLDEVNYLAKYLGVDHCLAKFPYEASGGEQQRISLLRALMMHPGLLLCDEPTGNLDSKNSSKVVGLLRELAVQFKAILLLVTHDERIASSFSRKILIEDGRIIR